MKIAAVFVLLLGAAAQDPEPGLVAEYFALDATPETFPAIAAARKPTFVRVEPVVHHALVTGDFHGTKLAENFFARWTGLLRCEQSGLYNFYVESDDGCRLYVDQELVVDNSAGRAMEQKADRLTLNAGDHAIRFSRAVASRRTGPPASISNGSLRRKAGWSSRPASSSTRKARNKSTGTAAPGRSGLRRRPCSRWSCRSPAAMRRSTSGRS